MGDQILSVIFCNTFENYRIDNFSFLFNVTHFPKTLQFSFICLNKNTEAHKTTVKLKLIEEFNISRRLIKATVKIWSETIREKMSTRLNRMFPGDLQGKGTRANKQIHAAT